MEPDELCTCDLCEHEVEEVWYCQKVNQHLCIECYEKEMNLS